MKRKATKEVPQLPQSFYVMPRYAGTTMTRRDLRDILLATDGRIMACGEMYDVVGKHIGAGVYRVTLRATFPATPQQ